MRPGSRVHAIGGHGAARAAEGGHRVQAAARQPGVDLGQGPASDARVDGSRRSRRGPLGDLRPHGGSDVGREDLQPGGASGRPANHCTGDVMPCHRSGGARWRARAEAARQGPGFYRRRASWQVEEEVIAQRVRLCRAWQGDCWQCLGDAIPVPIDMLSMAIDTPGSPDEEHSVPLFDSVLGR